VTRCKKFMMSVRSGLQVVGVSIVMSICVHSVKSRAVCLQAFFRGLDSLGIGAIARLNGRHNIAASLRSHDSEVVPPPPLHCTLEWEIMWLMARQEKGSYQVDHLLITPLFGLEALHALHGKANTCYMPAYPSPSAPAGGGGQFLPSNTFEYF